MNIYIYFSCPFSYHTNFHWTIFAKQRQIRAMRNGKMRREERKIVNVRFLENVFLIEFFSAPDTLEHWSARRIHASPVMAPRLAIGLFFSSSELSSGLTVISVFLSYRFRRRANINFQPIHRNSASFIMEHAPTSNVSMSHIAECAACLSSNLAYYSRS